MMKAIIKLMSLIVLILILAAGVSWIKTSEEAKSFKTSRRIYRGFGRFWDDASFVMKKRKKIGPTMKGNFISPAFRERLMLTVTAVNNCKSCSDVHTKEGIKSGLSREEIKMLLGGVIDHSPGEEIIALKYAKHWADADAGMELEAEQKIVKTYGKDAAEAIELVLKMIRLGNLASNTGAYLLYRISFGQAGDAETGICALPS